MSELSKPASSHDWCKHFQIIYETPNEKKKWPELIAMLGARICLIVSPKYYDGPGDFRWQFAKSVAWMIGLHNSQAKPFSDRSPFGFARHIGSMLLAEFPQACPYCGEKECNYDTRLHTSGLRRERRNATMSIYTDVANDDPDARNFSLDGWAKIILAIYPRDGDTPEPELSGKLAEEFAELARALRLYRRALSPRNGASDVKGSAAKGLDILRGDYSEEFADAFSRLCVFGRRVLGDGVSLDQVVWNVYKRGCPTCVPKLTEGPVCVCETFEATAKAVTLWDQDELLGQPQSQNIFNIHIDTRSNASAESFAEGSASIQIRPGEFEGVEAVLKAKGVDERDIAELRTALDADTKPSSMAALGKGVGDWIGKMVGKASRGSWQIGSAVAVNLLTKIIAAYYGFTS